MHAFTTFRSVIRPLSILAVCSLLSACQSEYPVLFNGFPGGIKANIIVQRHGPSQAGLSHDRLVYRTAYEDLVDQGELVYALGDDKLRGGIFRKRYTRAEAGLSQREFGNLRERLQERYGVPVVAQPTEARWQRPDGTVALQLASDSTGFRLALQMVCAEGVK